MRKWEDIVKDKLGGYESNLPEDSLAAFHARRAAVGATKTKRFPLVWAVVPAIAARLAPQETDGSGGRGPADSAIRGNL